MSYEDDYQYDDGTSSYYFRDENDHINPNDTYGDRFSVTQRKTSSKPRPAIIASSNHIKNKDRIFSKKHTYNRSIGRVDMASVAETASKITKEKEDKSNLVNEAAINNTPVSPQQNNNAAEKQETQPTQKLDSFRSSGLDSLFSSTAVPVKKDGQNQTNKTPDINKNQSKSGYSHGADETQLISANAFKKTDKNNDKETDSAHLKQTNPAIEASEQFKKLRGERKLRIIRPSSFNSTKDISIALSAGNAVVLSCKHLSESTARRVMDFAFGAASMCGAKVSLEGEKIFAFTIGNPLTKRERLLCIKEGLLLCDKDGEE